MDLDYEDFAFKYFTKGAPLKVENVLNYDLKEILKNPYVWVSTTIAAGLGVYYFLTSNDENSNNNAGGGGGGNNINGGEGIDSINNNYQYNYINDINHNHQQHAHPHSHSHSPSSSSTTHHITTTTTTTTTTSSSSSSLPIIQSPPPTTIQHVKLKNSKTGEPLPLEEQNLLLLKENSNLRGENRDLRAWVSNQINNINDRMEKMQLDLDREKYCHICEENEKQVCWRECGHRLCARCATLIKKSSQPQCSICRKMVTDFYLAWNT